MRQTVDALAYFIENIGETRKIHEMNEFHLECI